jgi:vacuolar-type H+-ATPase subunit F/Vma7
MEPHHSDGTDDHHTDTDGIVVIGSTGFLPGFALAGVRATVLASTHDVLERIRERHGASIIIVEDALLSSLSPQSRELLETSTRPVIIALGGDDTRIKQLVRNTLGVELI